MNDMPTNEVIVLALAGNSAKLFCTKSPIERDLKSLGFVMWEKCMERDIKDDSDRKQLTMQLITLGALFSGGWGWSPAELLGYYRDQGIITQPYRTIAWKNPNSYIIENN